MDNKDTNYEDLGKKLVELYETGHFGKKKVYSLSFMKGIISGLGAAIGGTVGITVLIWLLSRFHSLPLIGHLVETVQNSLNQ